MTSYENQGTGYDPHAVGHERQGRASAPASAPPLTAEELDEMLASFKRAREHSGYALASSWAMLYGPRLIAEVRAARQHSAPSVAEIACAIAGGFSNGNEQFHQASEPQQERYTMAAESVTSRLALPLPPAGDAVLREALPDDLLSHQHPWREALLRCRNNAAPASEDTEDRGYWQHELDVFDRVWDELRAREALAQTGGEQS